MKCVLTEEKATYRAIKGREGIGLYLEHQGRLHREGGILR